VPPPGPGHRRGYRFAESRIRRETIAAEDILHDMGVFSMMSSDSQAMGRWARCHPHLQTAHKMRNSAALWRAIRPQRQCPDQALYRKYTIKPPPSRTASDIWSVDRSRQAGRLGSVEAWFFGVKPSLILKGGSIAAAAMGDPTPRSRRRSPCAIVRCSAPSAVALKTSVTFVSQAGLDNPEVAAMGWQHSCVKTPERSASPT